jgi:hypothetical protein
MAEIRHLNADGATTQAQQTWGPFVSGAVEVDSDKIKFGVENIGTRALGGTPFSQLLLEIQQIGTNDGFTFYYTALDSAGTLSKPWGIGAGGAPIVSLSGGGSFSAGTYGVVIVAKNATGKTIGSTELVFTASSGQKALYTWVQTPGATGYEVYRTSTPGVYGASTLRAVISGGAIITYSDDGSATTSGTPPTVNTSGGAGPAYGTPPVDGSFDQTDKTIAVGPAGLAVGQQWFYWAQIRVPAATAEVGNRRTLNVTPVES